MITRALVGILACVLVPLGTVFTVIGLVADEVDSGSPDGFLYVGLALLAAGLACVGSFVVLQRAAAERKARRRGGARTEATVVRAHLLAGVRLGALLTYDLTVSFPAAGGEVTQRVAIAPSIALTPGAAIEIVYDPADPSNFEPAAHADLTRG